MCGPFGTIVSCASYLLAGDLDAIVGRYALPIVACVSCEHLVVDTPQTAAALLNAYRSEVISAGATTGDVKIVSQLITSDELAFVATRNTFRDARSNIVKSSEIAYVLRRQGDDWKIAVLSCS
jgi:ketosteroid isomerase-like protein